MSSVKLDFDFSKAIIPRDRDLKDVPRGVAQQILRSFEELNKTRDMLDRMRESIERQVRTTANSVVIVNSSSSGGSGGSSAPSLKVGTKALLANVDNLVTFTNPPFTSPFVLLIWCYTGTNREGAIGVDIKDVSGSGFKANPLMDSTLDYIAALIQ